MNVHKEQPVAQIELISGVDRRRRWTREEKQAHVARAFAPGVNVRAYTRQEDIAPSALYKWRQELKVPSVGDSGFTRVIALANQTAVLPGSLEAVPMVLSSCGAVRAGEASITLELRSGKAQIPQSTPPSLAAVIIQALVRQ
jgi:transposase